MIVTVTPNPSIDRTVRVPRLVRGEVNRSSMPSSEAAGKGLNVSRALHLHGIETLAVLPMAANSATTYLRLLGDAVPVAPVPIAGTIRTNLTVLEADGTVTKINEPGPEVREADMDALTGSADVPAAWIVGSGSLPPGAPVDFYARLARLRSDDRRIAVDSSGAALQTCLSADVDLIKPNVSELEQLVRAPLETLGEVLGAAQSLVTARLRALLVSLGPDGALYVDRDDAVHAEASATDVVNTVGAGDALLAGYLASGGGPGAVAAAVAWSVAAIRSTGTWMRRVGPADTAAVRVHPEIERARPLHRALVAAT